MDQMIFRGPFQKQPFHDSVSCCEGIWYLQGQEQDLISAYWTKQIDLFSEVLLLCFSNSNAQLSAF